MVFFSDKFDDESEPLDFYLEVRLKDAKTFAYLVLICYNIFVSCVVVVVVNCCILFDEV